MPEVRLYVRLNKGRIGIPLRKLAGIAGEVEKFVRMAAEDAGIDASSDRWLARDFFNGSLGFAIEYGSSTELEANSYRRVLADVMDFPNQRELTAARSRTVLQFARIGDHLDEDEEADFAFEPFHPSEETSVVPAKEFCSISRRVARIIADAVEDEVEYAGSVRGVIHALYKESSPAYFNLREILSHDIVKCMYQPRHYSQVVALLKRRDAIVHVAGAVTATRVDRSISQVRVDRLAEAPTFSRQDLEAVIGSMPDFTGKQSSAAAVARARRDRG